MNFISPLRKNLRVPSIFDAETTALPSGFTQRFKKRPKFKPATNPSGVGFKGTAGSFIGKGLPGPGITKPRTPRSDSPRFTGYKGFGGGIPDRY